MVTPDKIEQPFGCHEMELDGRPIYVPFLKVEFLEIEIIFHHFNTTVRQFNDPWADHVEVEVEETTKGIRFEHNLIDKFVEYEYPRRWNPYIDEASLEWLQMLEAARLEDELKGL